MHAASKIITVLILSYWICCTIILVDSKKYPCVIEGKVPDEEFGPDHYGELGYLRNVIIDVAQFVHKQMNLETPLRLCKLLSDTKTSYWDYFRISWKKKSRNEYGPEFNTLEKKAERVLNDLIKDARLTPEFSQADQEALAKVIDLAKDRLLKSKIYANEDGLLLKNLNKLRGTYCPKIPGSNPVGVESTESKSNHHGIDKLVAPTPLASTKFMPAIENLATNHIATSNVPSVSSLTNAAAVLPHLPIPSLKDQQKLELGGDGKPKSLVPPSLLKPPTSSEPSSENGQVGSPKPPLSDWIKPVPQTNQEPGGNGEPKAPVPPSLTKPPTSSEPSSENGSVGSPKPPLGDGVNPIPRPNQAIPEVAHRAPPTSPASVEKCASGKECNPVWVDKNGKVLGPANVHPDGKVYPAVAPNNYVYRPDQPQAASGDAAPQPPVVAKKFDYDPDFLRRLGYPEEEIKRLLSIPKEEKAAAAPAQGHVHAPAPAKPSATMKPQLPPGTISSADLKGQSIKLPQRSFSSRKADTTPMSASNLVYELQHPDEFGPKVLRADRPVIVQFHADYCDPCKEMMPILEKMVRQKQGKLYLVRIDTQQFVDLSDEHKVETLPDVRVFYGGRQVKEDTGYHGPVNLQQWVDSIRDTY